MNIFEENAFYSKLARLKLPEQRFVRFLYFLLILILQIADPPGGAAFCGPKS